MIFRELHSRLEIVNFCIATSLLYVFYIPSSGGRWSFTAPICAMFSALFHVSFLLAAFSVSNLIFLRLFQSLQRKLKFVALIINWGKLDNNIVHLVKNVAK